MGIIIKHGSFVFFVYVCFVSLLLCLLRVSEIGFTEFWRNLIVVTFEILLGAGVTIFFIDRLNTHRAEESLKHRLIREAGSRSLDVAISAVEWMDREGWLTGEDGLLKGADLREARLQEARLDGANLQGTIMDHADLRKAKLIRANLREAILTQAKLHNAKLNEAELQNAKFHSAELPNANLNGACLEDAKLEWVCLEGAILQRACFKAADLHRSKLSGASLWNAEFCGADLTFADLREAKGHQKASWEGAKLRYVDLEGVDFCDTNLQFADLECANLENANLSGTDLRGANLRGARLKGAKFRIFDGPTYAYVGDTPPDINDLRDEDIAHKTNWLGATLPDADGTVFTEEMDYKAIQRFTSIHDQRFAGTLASIEAYCNRP